MSKKKTFQSKPYPQSPEAHNRLVQYRKSLPKQVWKFNRAIFKALGIPLKYM